MLIEGRTSCIVCHHMARKDGPDAYLLPLDKMTFGRLATSRGHESYLLARLELYTNMRLLASQRFHGIATRLGSPWEAVDQKGINNE